MDFFKALLGQIGLGNVMAKLGNVVSTMKAQVAAFKALPLTFDSLVKQQNSIAQQLGSRQDVLPADMSALMSAGDSIDSARSRWQQLDREVDATIAAVNASGGKLNAELATQAASVALGMTWCFNTTKAVQNTLNQISSKYKVSGTTYIPGGTGTWMVVAGALGLWYLAKRKR